MFALLHPTETFVSFNSIDGSKHEIGPESGEQFYEGNLLPNGKHYISNSFLTLCQQVKHCLCQQVKHCQLEQKYRWTTVRINILKAHDAHGKILFFLVLKCANHGS